MRINYFYDRQEDTLHFAHEHKIISQGSSQQTSRHFIILLLRHDGQRLFDEDMTPR